MLTNLAIRMIVDPSLPKQPTHGVANLSFFFDQKRPGKKLGDRPPETIPLVKTIGLLRTQTLRENDGPIGIPIDDDLRPGWNFFWKTPPLQCKVTQRLISVLK